MVEIHLWSDQVVLFLGEVLGCNLDVMERHSGMEFSGLGCVAHELCDPVPLHLAEPSFAHL